MQNFLVPGGEFVVFGDPKQNVYHRPLDSNGDIRLGIIGGQWNRQLSNSHRFTNPRLAKLAMAFQSTYMLNIPKDDIQTEETMGNTLNFKIVSYSDIRNNFSLEKLIVDQCTGRFTAQQRQECRWFSSVVCLPVC